MAKAKKKILITEDEQSISNVLRNKLERYGFEVILASTGEESLNKTKAMKPDLVLLDLIMPHKDGFQVLEEMKKDKDMKKIDVIVFSNLGQEADMKRTKEMGASDYIIKSNMSISEVVEKINKVLGSRV
ncbi:response regulator [Candidatus Falkowbacteria bacterium CG11_big_fil_rev_8_21_14_0_20_39_10]|uniref:Response regulator n=1 Tax=Candidatus Falkowbacteria bacterium CG11_big_fil_rev_8_21_14_0_20_39_10 TaxID=1974570 RepID=A0A2M6K9C5_9BACT|nr:MAG: response regulator [Candidatus Falkowbacteria bacterium CG11_big_fil_rev_8_21_14_0_20_39_10]